MNVNVYAVYIRTFPADTPFSHDSPVLGMAGVDKQRVLDFVMHADRLRCLIGQLLIHRFVGEGIIRSDGMQNVKPVHPHVLFNLSHDADYVILVVSTAQVSVGVDIMKIQPSPINRPVCDMFSNLHAVFSQSEWEYIRNASDDGGLDCLSRFYHLWTAKEAYVKSIGTGLYTEPDEIEITMSSREHGYRTARTFHKGDTERSPQFVTQVYDTSIDGYIVSICVGPISLCDSSWTCFLAPATGLTPTQCVDSHISTQWHRVEISDLLGPS